MHNEKANDLIDLASVFAVLSLGRIGDGENDGPVTIIWLMDASLSLVGERQSLAPIVYFFYEKLEAKNKERNLKLSSDVYASLFDDISPSSATAGDVYLWPDATDAVDASVVGYAILPTTHHSTALDALAFHSRLSLRESSVR